MRDLIEYVVAEARRLGAEFADIRIVEHRRLTILLRNGVPEVSSGVDFGVAIRVYMKGSIGFAYTANASKQSVREALMRAYLLARAGAGSASAPKPVELKALEDEHEWPQQVNVDDVSIDEKLKDLQELDSLLTTKPFVKARTVGYTETVETRYYGSTEDRYVGERRTLVRVYAQVHAREGNVTASAHRVQGTIKGYVVWRKESQEEFAKRLLDRVESQLRAKTPKAGVFPVVLGPEAVGVFVHEAFGHLAEADLIAAGSALKGRLGQRVASEHVTIVDDPSVDDGFGTMKYDDEGVRTARVVIVEKGVHRQFMTDRLYASALNAEPTGNGRAESFRVRPLVRMRNTLMLPGDHSFEELLEGIDYGYYIVATRGGETNIDGSFQVGVQEAYEIVNGRIGDPVRNLSISGNTLETLLNVEAVGKELQVHYGTCGKGGQAVPVSLGGPHVRVKAMTVGGRA